MSVGKCPYVFVRGNFPRINFIWANARRDISGAMSSKCSCGFVRENSPKSLIFYGAKGMSGGDGLSGVPVRILMQDYKSVRVAVII